jgi:hypothetical protein
MPIWLQVLCIVGVVVLLTPVIARADNWRIGRALRRYGAWHCPSCGMAFGFHQKNRFWHVRRDPYVPGAPDSGVTLWCMGCQLEFSFDRRGRQVDKDFRYLQTEPRA